jgi:hypothetical protein
MEALCLFGLSLFRRIDMKERKDEVMTSKELANHLGLQRHNLDYLVDTGIIPEPRRIAGRRVFSAKEVRHAEEVVREKRKRAAVPDVIVQVEVQHE